LEPTLVDGNGAWLLPVIWGDDATALLAGAAASGGKTCDVREECHHSKPTAHTSAHRLATIVVFIFMLNYRLFKLGKQVAMA